MTPSPPYRYQNGSGHARFTRFQTRAGMLLSTEREASDLTALDRCFQESHDLVTRFPMLLDWLNVQYHELKPSDLPDDQERLAAILEDRKVLIADWKRCLPLRRQLLDKIDDVTPNFWRDMLRSITSILVFLLSILGLKEQDKVPNIADDAPRGRSAEEEGEQPREGLPAGRAVGETSSRSTGPDGQTASSTLLISSSVVGNVGVTMKLHEYRYRNSGDQRKVEAAASLAASQLEASHEVSKVTAVQGSCRELVQLIERFPMLCKWLDTDWNQLIVSDLPEHQQRAGAIAEDRGVLVADWKRCLDLHQQLMDKIVDNWRGIYRSFVASSPSSADQIESEADDNLLADQFVLIRSPDSPTEAAELDSASVRARSTLRKRNTTPIS